VPLPIRAGRIGSSLAARAYRFDLRDHLIFPGLINAHDHLHVNAVPPLKTGAPFPTAMPGSRVSSALRGARRHRRAAGAERLCGCGTAH
jgi:predicted amidohydrolase YtcJ